VNIFDIEAPKNHWKVWCQNKNWNYFNGLYTAKNTQKCVDSNLTIKVAEFSHNFD